MATIAEFVSLESTASVGLLEATAHEASALRYRLPADGIVVREVRARKMPTIGAVFDEFAAAWQFPYYFGENKDAFDECMRDLDEFVGRARGYVVVVRDCAELLRDERAELDWFFDAMAFYTDEWANLAEPAVFRVVLQTEPGSSAPVRAARLTLD